MRTVVCLPHDASRHTALACDGRLLTSLSDTARVKFSFLWVPWDFVTLLLLTTRVADAEVGWCLFVGVEFHFSSPHGTLRIDCI